MRLFLSVGIAASVKADLQLGFGPGLRDRGDVDAIFPNNRTRVAQPRNRRLPADILTRLSIPRGRQRFIFSKAARLRTAELRPLAGVRLGDRAHEGRDSQTANQRNACEPK